MIYEKILSDPCNVYLIDLPKRTNDIPITVVARGGYIFNPGEKTNLNHLLEHFLANPISQMKLSYKASINPDTIDFFMLFDKKKLEKNLPKFLSSLFQPDFTDTKTFELERRILLSEISEWQINLGERVFHLLTNEVKPHDPNYTYDTLRFDHIRTAQIEEIEEIYKKIFTKPNIEIFIGVYQPSKELVQYFKDIFGSLPISDGSLLPFPTLSEYPPFQVIREPFYNEQISLNLFWPAPNREAPWLARLPLGIMREMLTHGVESVLFQSLRAENGLVYRVSESRILQKKIGYYQLSLSVFREDLDRVIQMVQEDLERFKKGQFDEKKSLKTARDFIKSNERGWKDNKERYQWIMNDLQDYGKVIDFEEMKGEIKKIDSALIRQRAKEIFDPGHLIIIMVGAGVDKVNLEIENNKGGK